MFLGGTWAAEHPEQVAAIVPVVMSLVGLAGILLPNRLGKQKTRSTDRQEQGTLEDATKQEPKAATEVEAGIINYQTGTYQGNLSASEPGWGNK